MVKVINNIPQPQKLRTWTSHVMNNKQTLLQQGEKHQNQTCSEQMTFSHQQKELFTMTGQHTKQLWQGMSLGNPPSVKPQRAQFTIKVINNISQPQRLSMLKSHEINNKQTPLQLGEKHQN